MFSRLMQMRRKPASANPMPSASIPAQTLLAGSAAERAPSTRRMKVVAVQAECATVRSVSFAAEDGAALPPVQPGQYIVVGIPDQQGAQVARPVTVSSAAAEPRGLWQISVRRVPEGRFSAAVHSLNEGDTIEASPPMGDFTIDLLGAHPLVMIAGGIGITPFRAQIEAIVGSQRRRPVTVFHSVRSQDDHPFAEWLRQRQNRDGIRYVVTYTREQCGSASQGMRRFAAQAVITEANACQDTEFLMCGPPGMVADLSNGLHRAGINPARIRSETFRADEPAGTQNSVTDGSAPTHAFAVGFERSRSAVAWASGCTNLLELAEQHGVPAKRGCGVGKCHTCKARLLAGQVQRLGRTPFGLANDEILLCSTRPLSDVTIDL